ncbi:hypothetical protein BC834DRAFT_924730 [Gloeopeniophorella convolvens]|nr:hypothetical protein BC834DRAFT_924730 [Gloeopeniophorella convolvens]
MAFERRATFVAGADPAAAAASSSSSYARRPTQLQRTDSPPASAYFSPSFAPGDPHPMHPAPGAQAHFAYSTTLRRHNVDGSGATPASAAFPAFESIRSAVAEEGPSRLWDRLVGLVRGSRDGAAAAENGYAPLPKAEDEETPAAKYASVPAEDVVAHFRTSSTHGLAAAAVPALREAHGYNEFSVAAPEPLLLKFAQTIYESPLILLLCGSAVVSAVMGNVDDAVSITVAILIVLTVGFVQERRSEKSLEALNKLVPHHCHIVRDGAPHHVLANEVVPGDLVTFATGDRVPADVRLLAAADLEIDESSLTGETDARRKHPAPAPRAAPLAERACIAYMGTLVRAGRGAGVVVATGARTEFGVVFGMVQDVAARRTPLQLSMDDLAKRLSLLSFAIIGLICLVGVVQRRPWLDMFTIGVSLAVAAIPEGLPIVTTVTLALGVLRMSKRRAIVKKLHAVEALGAVSVICADKTGTLTRNEQAVAELYAVDELVPLDTSGAPAPPQHHHHHISPALRRALEIGALCNDARTDTPDGAPVGHAMDVALLRALAALGLPDPRPAFTRTAERPFSSDTKTMVVSGTHAAAGSPREMLYAKGALEALLPRCRFYHVADGSTPALDAGVRAAITARAGAAAARGLRVLALAYGYGSATTTTSTPAGTPARTPSPNPDDPPLVFAGFAAMLDPPRRGAADAVGLLQRGGVRVVMITGDAPDTARAIARALGLRAAGAGACVTGAELDAMAPGELRARVGGPRHKMAIVAALQARGEVVAMTGDGVNDAPALKMADIGVSMGKSGTDVAKEAADVILVDDNFSTILPAIEEGKSIFHNIQNFLSFQLSTAAAALTLITLSTCFGLSNPLNAMQILFINILMDGPPSQSLGVDPVDRAVMRRPPRRKDDPIITRRILARVVFSASLIVAGTLFIYFFALSDEHMSRREQTMTFTCFVLLDLVSAVQNRGLGCALGANRMLLLTVGVSAASQLALVYVPLMQAVFQTEALPLDDLLLLLALAAGAFALHEGRRRYERALARRRHHTNTCTRTWPSAGRRQRRATYA